MILRVGKVYLSSQWIHHGIVSSSFSKDARIEDRATNKNGQRLLTRWARPPTNPSFKKNGGHQTTPLEFRVPTLPKCIGYMI